MKNYKDFLARHDMVFEKPACQWEQGIFMGNGMLGTVVWGGGDRPMRISLDRADIWELRNIKPDYEGEFNWRTFTHYLETHNEEKINKFLFPGRENPNPTRFPVGRLEFSAQGKVINHTMRLHLAEAVTEGRTETDKGEIQWKTWISATSQILVVETWAEGEDKFSMRPKFLSRLGDYMLEDTIESTRWKAYGGMEHPERKPHTMTQFLKDWGYPDSLEGQNEDVHWWTQEIPENGGYAVAWKTLMPEPGHEILLLTISCDRINADPSEEAVAAIKDLTTEDVTALWDAHCAWWEQYYTASFLSIPDTKLEALYYIEVYKLACSTRPDGLHMTLQGPWSEDDNLPAYCMNDYHWNLEQQMQLWSIYTGNRLEYGMPMYDMIDKAMPILKDFCRKFFECDGAFLAHCTDIDCKPLLCNIDNFEFNGLPWVAFMYWQHYLYSMDEAFLRERTYPLMKEALRPLIPELKMGEDGYLHLPWSSSPEYYSPQETTRWIKHENPDWAHRFGPDATIDLSLIKFLCRALLKSCDTLQIEEAERPAWEYVLEHITPYAKDEFGGLAVRGDLNLTSSHRHQSHLFPIYPLHEMTMESDAATINNSLTVLGIYGQGEWTGWSFPWAALIAAYGGRPSLARNLLLDYADRYVTESTVHYQGPQKGCDISLYQYPGGNFGQTIEAGFGAIAAIQELAIQSVGGVIRLFENTPPAWADVTLQDMRTEGAFLVSAVRKEYVTKFVQVKAEQGGELKLRTGFGNGVVYIQCNSKIEKARLENGMLTWNTQKGDELVIWAGDSQPELVFAPVEGNPFDHHFYGVKKVSRF